MDTRLAGVGVCEYDLRALAYAGISKGDKVLAELNPFEAPAVTIIKTMPDGEERRWTVKPMEKDAFGFDAEAAIIGQTFKSQPDTVSDKALKDIAAEADPTEEAKAKGIKHAYSNVDAMADVRTPRALYFRHKGTDVLGDAPKVDAIPLTMGSSHAAAAPHGRGCFPYQPKGLPIHRRSTLSHGHSARNRAGIFGSGHARPLFAC